MSRYVIAYDIPVDRRRARVARTLESYGRRVQYSVFEAQLSSNELRSLLADLKALVEPMADGIRVYRLCERCAAETHLIGGVGITEEPEAWIV